MAEHFASATVVMSAGTVLSGDQARAYLASPEYSAQFAARFALRAKQEAEQKASLAARRAELVKHEAEHGCEEHLTVYGWDGITMGAFKRASTVGDLRKALEGVPDDMPLADYDAGDEGEGWRPVEGMRGRLVLGFDDGPGHHDGGHLEVFTL